MANIPEWLKSDGLDEGEILDLMCPSGSFTCGLITKLGLRNRCKNCKERGTS